ncbi:hypothetical protein EWH08_05860 [Sphingobium indicum]|uniref:Uncharacterized protein n=2 Tax=Sphingobium indicum TaxID=332055 RepID=A0A1L5BN07_SPHIB|nr:hypothetical protein [Sphingobium indicum]APL94259.1 hypothetical protein SIDU_06930 [Sphingobium indicum B90A]KEY97550.1 hypothetical protein AI27_18090 [Sphingomonas sp. BHC-A]NYI21188.1 hypothetical protein [Sphingobium indicum]RYM04005.1 hypothetical protein EWH08_05860 [Sphingobium indicum]
MASVRSFCVLAMIVALPLAGCGKKADDLNALDAQLTNNAADALANQIVVDPRLAGQSQASARLPALKGEAATALAAAVKLAGGRLLAAPAPAEGEAKESESTLAAVAGEQKKPGGNAFCREQLVQGAQWVSRLPEPFTVYPGAQLTEAAGAEKDGCTLRAATFVTPVPWQSVMDFYYTQARRAGFDAEHRVMGGDHVLGGTRKGDGSAFLLLFTQAPGGRTSVDVLADNGR